MRTLLQINVCCNRGSTGKIAEQIGETAISKGWKSYIAYARDYSPSKSNTIKIGSRVSIIWHGLMTRLFDCHGLCSRIATRRLIKKLEEIKPDVVHLHNIHGYFINYPILFDYLKRSNVKVVWTLHDCWTFTGHCSHFSYLSCDRWKNGCYKCPQKNHYPKSMFLDRSKSNYELKKRCFTGIKDMTIVTPSQWLADLVKESFLKDYPVKVINNGIDISVFNPTPSDFKERYSIEGKAVILSVASVWGNMKGYDDYMRLAKMLDSDYQIVLVGVTPEQKLDLAKVGILGIERTNSSTELAEIYSASDVFVNLTYQDTYPTVNLEARACGLPVITYKTGGSPESAGSDAIVVNQGDLQGVVAALSHIRANNRNYRQTTNIENFSSKKKFEEYVELYDQL